MLRTTDAIHLARRCTSMPAMIVYDNELRAAYLAAASRFLECIDGGGERPASREPRKDRPVGPRGERGGGSGSRLLLSIFDEFVEHLTHRCGIAVHGDRRRDVAVGVWMLPVERVTGVTGELLEEGALRPAVSLSRSAARGTPLVPGS